MPKIILKAKVDELLARRVEKIIRNGMFENEEENLKGAIKEMMRKIKKLLRLSEIKEIEKATEKDRGDNKC